MTVKKGNPIAPKIKIALSLVSTSTATSLNSGNLAPQNNAYLAIGGLPAVVVDPETRVQQAKAVGSVVYEGFKTVLKGLHDCSDMFLPLKTAAGGILTIIEFVEVCVLVYNNMYLWLIRVNQTVLENKKELEDLKAKLEAILSIVKQYQKQDSLRALRNRIEIFCTFVACSCSCLYSSIFCSAVTTQLKLIEDMQKHSVLVRGAEGAKDADMILKAIRNINSLCDVFQVGFRAIDKASRGC